MTCTSRTPMCAHARTDCTRPALPHKHISVCNPQSPQRPAARDRLPGNTHTTELLLRLTLLPDRTHTPNGIQRLCTQRHIPPPRPRRRPPATGHSRLSEKRLASSACCCCCCGMTGAMPMAPAICCCCCKTCCCMSTCCCIAICCCIAACCCCHMARCCWAARCCMTACCGVTRGVGMHLALPRPGEPPIAPKSALSCERSPPIERNAAAVGADAIALSAPMATFGAGGGAGAAAPPFGAVRSAKLTTDSARDSSECGSFGGGGPASAGPGRAVPPPAEAEVEAEAAPLAPSARMASSSFLRVAAAA
mmetsp:Transcript_36270/g.117150  ORF Transcript_36270/g.117150 Transcript_36270/m.117150 type:complete len:307 (-) Transcript_36270:1705-2625(-)